MQAAPDLPTWQILPEPGGVFRWSLAGGDPNHRPKTLVSVEDNNAVAPALPSMADLLLQASPKLLEDGDGGDDGAPMFRTGSGRSVSFRESSLLKAASLLGGGDDAEKGYLPLIQGSGDGDACCMFQTGSGKFVAVRQSSIKKAVSLLGEPEKTKKGYSGLPGGGNGDTIPKFQTGSGKPVAVKESSIRKAASILEGESLEKDQMHNFRERIGCSCSTSLFQTGSGKQVNISSAGVYRATSLLGSVTNCKYSSSKGLDFGTNQFNSNITDGGDNSHTSARSGMNSESANLNIVGLVDVKSIPRNAFTYARDKLSLQKHSKKDALQNLLGSGPDTSASTTPPIKFETAGGKTLSVSSAALQRARSLLGDSEPRVSQNVTNTSFSPFSFVKKEKTFANISWNKENVSFACLDKNAGEKDALPIRGLFSGPKQLSSLETFNPQGIVKANSLVSEGIRRSERNILKQNLPSKYLCRSSGEPLVEISNNINADIANRNHFQNEKKRLGRTKSISPFKKPRNSRFATPLDRSSYLFANGLSKLPSSKDFCQKTRVSTRYPFQLKRKSVKEYFGRPPFHHNLLEDLSEEVKHMNADKAERYIFKTSSSLDGIGAEVFHHMLLKSGASPLNATKEWVANHYKWIVWKLACLERGYPVEASGKYLTVSNVLEELKYRYEREVNYGHRSALKRILDGDASPASSTVLCISAIRSYIDPKIGKMKDTTTPSKDANICIGSSAESNHIAKLELTDGWYSLDAILDLPLLKHLVSGKLYVGQKLRIEGAALCGWVGPVSPLEASETVNLLIHINGTYRAHWADPLGFCKHPRAPLAFRCIKGAGGQVPKTLVGVTRVYPILYKERFPDGGSMVRSERMENKMLQSYNQRRSSIAEDVISEQQKDFFENDNDAEEGAKIFKILETSAEPELLMADMSSEQLLSFSTYRAKQEATWQADIYKKIEKAWEDAGLCSRVITPFMRVRVVGLTRKGSSWKGRNREGLVTIWNPTEKQKVDLVEGQMYYATGLSPLNFGSEIIYLQARGSTSLWKSLPPIAIEKFEPFFIPRRPILLSNLGEVPLASEFDTAAVVVYVGDAYSSGRQKKQWLFMTDGSKSISELELEGSYDCLLAVSFCSPITDGDSSALVSHTLSGSTVGFFNLIKRARDQVNHLWVAEASENSTYAFPYSLPSGSHLKEASDSVHNWAKLSSVVIEKLRERVLDVIGFCGS